GLYRRRSGTPGAGGSRAALGPRRPGHAGVYSARRPVELALANARGSYGAATVLAPWRARERCLRLDSGFAGRGTSGRAAALARSKGCKITHVLRALTIQF